MTSDDRGSAFAGLGQPGLARKLHEQLDELLTARDQMEQLLRVIVEIGADLDLDATLRPDHLRGQEADLRPLRRVGNS